MSGAPVLYVEDEESDAFFMHHAFQRMGSAPPLMIVKNGREALDYLAGREPFSDRAQHQRPCLVLLDLNLPIMSGFEVLAWIRNQPQFNDMPVVIFSASRLDVDREHAMKSGAKDYIVKPNDMTSIPEILQPVMAALADPAT